MDNKRWIISKKDKKNICIKIPSLSLPTGLCEWIVTTNVSDVGWGATLFFKEKDKIKICKYNLRIFNKVE